MLKIKFVKHKEALQPEKYIDWNLLLFDKMCVYYTLYSEKRNVWKKSWTFSGYAPAKRALFAAFQSHIDNFRSQTMLIFDICIQHDNQDEVEIQIRRAAEAEVNNVFKG